MSRTVLRNDDLGSVKATQRPLNEAFREVSAQFDSLPQRHQAWVRFTPGTIASFDVRAPEFPLAAVLLLQAIRTDTGTSAFTAAPWVDWVPVDGSSATVRILTLYGVATSVTVDLLLEFVEDVTGGQNRSNPTGGVP